MISTFKDRLIYIDKSISNTLLIQIGVSLILLWYIRIPIFFWIDKPLIKIMHLNKKE